MSRQGTRVTDTKKVSGELFSLTYGALVSQILKDYHNVEDVNKQLEKMGYNIGVRIIEDFLARTKEGRCTDFRDTAEKVQAGFKMYLNVSPTVTSWSSANDEFSLVFEVFNNIKLKCFFMTCLSQANPLGEFVELPDNYNALKYSNILCGAIRSL